MDPKFSKLRHNEKQEAVSQEQTQARTGREFASPEELLRYDAAQTVVPSSVAERLDASLEKLPPPPKPWWRKLFGRGSK